MEFGFKYTVGIYYDLGTAFWKMECSCGRFFDEGIACQHILKVPDFTRGSRPESGTITLSSLIDPLYLRSRFIKTFSEKLVFILKGYDLYIPNENVIPSHWNPKLGARRSRRFGKAIELALNLGRVSRPPIPSVKVVVPKTEMKNDKSVSAFFDALGKMRRIFDSVLSSGQVFNPELNNDWCSRVNEEEVSATKPGDNQTDVSQRVTSGKSYASTDEGKSESVLHPSHPK